MLCQQELGIDAKKRLGHFEQFVKGGLESSAQAAEKVLDALVKQLPTLPQAKDWAIQASLLKIDEEKAVVDLAGFTLRRNAAEVALQLSEIPAFDWSPYEQAIAGIAVVLLAEEKSLKELQQDGKRKVLEARVLELRALQWLSQNKIAVAAEVTRLSAVSALDKALGLANTAALTKKNNELAKHELDAGYQVRFANELKQLGGARLPVKPESKQQGKGKITFGISLHGAKKIVSAEGILSEGETRIVALAAFLADITGSGQPSPFVFDDPISSLDQDFEERVVGRLVDLAKSRQVIVFTHRLSLLTLLDSAVKRLKEQADLEKTAAPVMLHVESVRRMGKQAGMALQLSVRDAKPKAAVEGLRLTLERLEREQRTRSADRVTRQERLTGEVRQLEAQRRSASVAVDRLQYNVEQRVVRAPVSGRLAEVAALRAGAYINAGQTLGVIVPEGKLRVVAEFAPPAAMGRVRTGQRAQIRLDGFPWSQYGSIPARVFAVAGEVRNGTVRVEMDVDGPSPVTLQHGMPGSAEVLVEEVSPVTMALRAAGHLIASPRSPYGDK